MTVPLDHLLRLAGNHQQNGRSDSAKAAYLEVLELDPNQVPAIEALARIHFEGGELSQAIEMQKRAVALRPEDFAHWRNLGMALSLAGRHTEAIDALTQAIRIAPNSADEWLQLGVALMRTNRLDEARIALEKSATLRPEHKPMLVEFGNRLLADGHFSVAKQVFERLITLAPTDADSHFALGVAQHRLNDIDGAIAQYRAAIRHRPSFAAAHFNLGKAADARKRYAEAADHYRQTRSLDPTNLDAGNNLGVALQNAGLFEEAVEVLRQTLARNPNSSRAHNNLGSALQDLFEYDAALSYFRSALSLQPGFPEAEWNLAMVLLKQGKLADGFKHYDARLRVPGLVPGQRFSQPMWDGADLAGKTILLHAEQGYGDAVQFIRYAPLLHDRGAKVLLLCPPELHRLFRGQLGIEAIYGRRDATPHFDVHCPLPSLAAQFETLPTTAPYLRADPTLAENWKYRCKALPGRRVGLVWAGSPAHANDANRSLPLTAFSEIAAIDGVCFVNLQKGDAGRQSPPPGMRLIDWTSELHDLADTAALISQLDGVIAVDTCVAHLASALGKETWLLLPKPADWRWQLDRTDSPWYPTMRLFRQPARGDWSSPVRELAEALRKRLD